MIKGGVNLSELDEKVYFSKTTGEGKNELEVTQDIVKLKIKQTGTMTVKFEGQKEELSKIKDFFESMTDMEPLNMNIASSGDIKAYFKGISPFTEKVSPEGENYYSFEVTIQELIE